MGKHLPAIVWPAKRVGEYPQVYIRTVDKDNISFGFYPGVPNPGVELLLSRRLARMTARRINECLDRTRA